MENSKVLAEAVIKNFLEHQEGEHASCRFCKVWLAWEEHDSECPVLLAQKVIQE